MRENEVGYRRDKCVTNVGNQMEKEAIGGIAIGERAVHMHVCEGIIAV